MFNVANLSLRMKLLMLVLPPLLTAIFYGATDLQDRYSTNQEMVSLSKRINLSVYNSRLVHEIQKERGLSAAYMGSGGKSFIAQLQEQRKNTDKAIQLRQNFLDAHTFSDPEINGQLSTISSELSNISGIRKQASSLSVPLGQILGYYSKLNGELLGVAVVIAKLADDPSLSSKANGYYSFLQAKEKAGIERAVLSNAFSRGQFTPELFERFIALMTSQNVFLDRFELSADKKELAFYKKQMAAPEVKKVSTLRQQAKRLNLGEFVNVKSSDWFDTATLRINKLKMVEDFLSESMLQRVNQLQKDSETALIITSILMSFLFIVVIIGGIWIMMQMIRHVRNLTDTLKRIREDNDLHVRATCFGSDEFGQMANALNATMDKFEKTIALISGSSVQLAASVEEISATIRVNVDNMNEQQSQTTKVAEAVEEMAASAQDVANNTTSSVTAAKDANELTTAGVRIVNQANEAIHELAKQVSNLGDSINKLQTASGNISNVIDVIKSIADQTNLLALNAAIEAARAGEQGRGFAVVAEEVRTLAQRTQNSTGEIETMILELQEEVGAAFSNIDSSREKAEQVVNESTEAANALTNIESSINQILGLSEQIASAVNEQQRMTDSVSNSIGTIDTASRDTVTSIEQISLATEEQTVMANELQTLASNFKFK